MLLRSATTLLLLLALLCATTDVRAGQLPAATLVLASPSEGWPPYHMGMDAPPESGRGIMADVLTAACRPLGIAVAVRHYPEKRCMMLLEQGIVHVYTKAIPWVEAPERFHWSTGVVVSQDTLLFPAEEPVRTQPLSNLHGLRIGTVLGYIYPALEPLFASGAVQRDDAPDVHGQIHKLLHGRTDAAVVNKLVAQWVLANGDEALDTQDTPLAFSARPIEAAQYRFVFSPAHDWSGLVALIDEQLQWLQTSGRLAAILDRYR